MAAFVKVSFPIRHYGVFDYRCDAFDEVPIGTRVLAPLGKAHKVGVVIAHAERSEIAPDRLRTVDALIDDEPAFPPRLIRTLLWTASYYQQPVGELIWIALPQAIRGTAPLQPNFPPGYGLTAAGRALDAATLARARVQKAIVERLQSGSELASARQLRPAGSSWRAAVRALIEKDLVFSSSIMPAAGQFRPQFIHPLTAEQHAAKERIISALGRFSCLLLHGVTGSGKTEVYLHAIAEALRQGGQVLMLVPEIGLTPQLEERVCGALGLEAAVYHSSQTEAHRHRTWWLARTARAQVFIGTRSAVFLPFARLSLIVIDEEHDASFKQHERLRYHARAVAIHRAANEQIPIVCGTATPSLESVFATQTDRMEVLTLLRRATDAQMPAVSTIDLNTAAVRDGISVRLLDQLKKGIAADQQSLIFINRRGFSPLVICGDCRAPLQCSECDINLVYHHFDRLLHCHRCLKRFEMPEFCPQCSSVRLSLLGAGTQRIEDTLRNAIPGARVLRIDRDTTRSHREFEKKITRIRKREVDILVGTQMLSKGHDFPEVTLVGVLNADAGFFSTDFRAKEFMIQQILQVAGRAGRADKPGRVLIQTLYPEHPIFDCIRRHDYLDFAASEIEQRKLAAQPPFVHYALLRANALVPGAEIDFLESAKAVAASWLAAHGQTAVTTFDIVQSPVARVSSRHRAQLLCASQSAGELRRFLSAWISELSRIKSKGQLRWSLDVDPIDFS